MQQLMDRDAKDREDDQSEDSMHKYASERKVSAYVYPDKKSYSEKNYAGRPEKDHQARFSPYII